jgi:hypothetical protein
MSFEEWWYEQEGFGLRAERFFEEECERDMQLFINMKKWLEAAYEAGQGKCEWVYLTEEEMLDIVDTYGMPLADAIEAKLKEKNT